MINGRKIAVVIPSFKVTKHIIDVIDNISSDIDQIYVVDDACPENSGKFVINNTNDNRIKVVFNEINLGVGGAVLAGYKQALNDKNDIVVKIDGDGQMNPELIKDFIKPILLQTADYTKGNRFYNIDDLSGMPLIRIFGNAFLSFLSKLSTGYWNIFDPTNGYTAISSSIIKLIINDDINKRFFFETDVLFRLNIRRAVVKDIPMRAVYGEERSNLNIIKVIPLFIYKHTSNFFKRIFYNYILRDVSLASLELFFGIFLLLIGIFNGINALYFRMDFSIPASPGLVMLAALPIILGIQFILAFIAYDISSIPRNSITQFEKN